MRLRERANWRLRWQGVAAPPLSPLLSPWLGGWVAYGGLGRNPSGVTHRRPGATQAGPAIAVGDSVSPSRRGGQGLMFEIPPRKHPKLNPLLPPPTLRTPACRRHIAAATPLSSPLVRIRRRFTSARAARGQQVAGLARHSGPTSKVKHTARVRPSRSLSLSLCCHAEGGSGKERQRGEDKIKGGMC